jgi:hypothetical protein
MTCWLQKVRYTSKSHSYTYTSKLLIHSRCIHALRGISLILCCSTTRWHKPLHLTAFEHLLFRTCNYNIQCSALTKTKLLQPPLRTQHTLERGQSHNSCTPGAIRTSCDTTYPDITVSWQTTRVHTTVQPHCLASLRNDSVGKFTTAL